jgi:hypothetical protein
MPFTGDYNLAAVQCTVGSFRVTGWAPDDAVALSPMSDLWESEASADGSHVSRSRINDPRWEATLKVRRGTAAYRLLVEALQSQLESASSGAVPALAFQVYDPISGDKITERAALFKRYPDLPFAKSASDAEFKLELANPTITAGANIDTSA